jgi:hypothetical protein
LVLIRYLKHGVGLLQESDNLYIYTKLGQTLTSIISSKTPLRSLKISLT